MYDISKTALVEKGFIGNISSHEVKVPMSQNNSFTFQRDNISGKLLTPFLLFANAFILPNSTLIVCHEII